jgi:hypothetical protein
LGGLPYGETLENLPARLSFDLPKDWPPLKSFRLTSEQIEHRTTIERASKRLADFISARMRVEVGLPPVSKPQPQSKGQGKRTHEKIRQVAASKWPNGYDGIRSRDLIKVVGDATGEKPDTILRALGRRKG